MKDINVYINELSYRHFGDMGIEHVGYVYTQ